ncbi:MAG: potassium transporter TrkG [Acidimicrobiales bacterium]
MGAGLLMPPIATEGPGGAPALTALFTSTSAVCVTGLAVVDTPSYWSTFGELTIAGLIQVGGFGIMTLSSMIILALAGRLGLRQRLLAAAESGALEIGEIRRLVAGVARLSFAVEGIAALLLGVRFATTHGEPAGRAAYLGVFHAVSAFNNAGFALQRQPAPFQRDPVILLVIAACIIVGGWATRCGCSCRRTPPGRDVGTCTPSLPCSPPRCWCWSARRPWRGSSGPTRDARPAVGW